MDTYKRHHDGKPSVSNPSFFPFSLFSFEWTQPLLKSSSLPHLQWPNKSLHHPLSRLHIHCAKALFHSTCHQSSSSSSSSNRKNKSYSRHASHHPPLTSLRNQCRTLCWLLLWIAAQRWETLCALINRFSAPWQIIWTQNGPDLKTPCTVKEVSCLIPSG